MSEKNVNARLEAFSDGVFAFALTLLIIDVEIPPAVAGQTAAEFWQEVVTRWPSWFGFLLSFCIIFVTWFNHYRILRLIDKTSPLFAYANGFKLFTIVILPFTTGFMAEHLQTNQQAAVSMYCFGSLLNNVSWNVLLWASMYPRPLAKEGLVFTNLMQIGIKGTRIGFVITLAIFVLSFWFPITALVLTSVIWITWAVLGSVTTRVEPVV